MILPYCTCVRLGDSGMRITAYCLFHDPNWAPLQPQMDPNEVARRLIAAAHAGRQRSDPIDDCTCDPPGFTSIGDHWDWCPLTTREDRVEP